MGYNPSYKWINPTYPIYNWGCNPLTKWDEPPSKSIVTCTFQEDQLDDVQQICPSFGAFAAVTGDGRVITWGDDDFGADAWEKTMDSDG